MVKYFITFWMFLLGASIGSFLNVVIYRLPRGESIVYPPSRCPKCGHKLGAKDLVPVFSYIWLRGRCRYCGEKISARYIMVETLLGLSFSILFWFFGFSLFTIKSALFISLLIPIFFIDLDHMIIPDIISIPGTILGIMMAFLGGNLKDGILGAILSGIILLLIYLFALIIYKQEGMGQGDIKLGLLLGSFLGIKLGVFAIFLGFLIGGIFSIIILLKKEKNLKDAIPFGPFLVVGGIISYFWGNQIIDLYIKFFL
ncbi:MAG: prepilin peptidase [Dictyoglomus sp. NZ13-RE01]|nr:MAG: prepilin peptidase [Dictyoglomus sp. NZ13-RE01]